MPAELTLPDGTVAIVDALVWTAPTREQTDALNVHWVNLVDILPTERPDPDFEAARIMAMATGGKPRRLGPPPETIEGVQY